MIWIYVIIGFIALVLILFIVLRNTLIGSRNLVDAAFADMDALLLKRYELIPKLVTITQGYAQHEAQVLEEIAAKRSTIWDDNETAKQLAARLQVIKEAYPDLKADENFERLMNQITETENHLLYSRQFYNGTVEQYNRRIESFPYSLFSQQQGFTKKKYVAVAAEAHQIPNYNV